LDINAAALGAVQLLLIEHRNHRIQTHTELSPGLPPILVDRGQITQALLHVMNHATDFVVESGTAGSITIRTWFENGSVMWSCAATGGPAVPGTMPASGFRLSASHSMIQDQGGRLGVHDVSGEGPVFVVSLPADPAIPAEAIRASAAHS
jgi:signal transduction histidine kinase